MQIMAVICEKHTYVHNVLLNSGFVSCIFMQVRNTNRLQIFLILFAFFYSTRFSQLCNIEPQFLLWNEFACKTLSWIYSNYFRSLNASCIRLRNDVSIENFLRHWLNFWFTKIELNLIKLFFLNIFLIFDLLFWFSSVTRGTTGVFVLRPSNTLALPLLCLLQ
jgi:hypothetical protein